MTSPAPEIVRVRAVAIGLLLAASASTPAHAQPTTSQRVAAATATAGSASNACSTVRPFYWEVGDRAGMRASGSVLASTTQRITARTPMPYASASKWLYGAYVAEVRGGRLSDLDIAMLHFRSGYTSLRGCEQTQTVDGCLATDSNGVYNAQTDGRYFYNGGHMQKHASLIGLGAAGNAELATALRARLGSDIPVSYSQPQLAGGGFGTPETYARFLRKLLGGTLRLGAQLGTRAVCTNPAVCGLDEALHAPIPDTEAWTYSIGHWVESDPVVGDGAFSSGGTFGFYPWIDASKTWYGVLARIAPSGGIGSVQCGRLIRKAWLTGTAQEATASTPPVGRTRPARRSTSSR